MTKTKIIPLSLSCFLETLDATMWSCPEKPLEYLVFFNQPVYWNDGIFLTKLPNKFTVCCVHTDRALWREVFKQIGLGKTIYYSLDDETLAKYTIPKNIEDIPDPCEEE